MAGTTFDISSVVDVDLDESRLQNLGKLASLLEYGRWYQNELRQQHLSSDGDDTIDLLGPLGKGTAAGASVGSGGVGGGSAGGSAGATATSTATRHVRGLLGLGSKRKPSPYLGLARVALDSEVQKFSFPTLPQLRNFRASALAKLAQPLPDNTTWFPTDAVTQQLRALMTPTDSIASCHRITTQFLSEYLHVLAQMKLKLALRWGQLTSRTAAGVDAAAQLGALSARFALCLRVIEMEYKDVRLRVRRLTPAESIEDEIDRRRDLRQGMQSLGASVATGTSAGDVSSASGLTSPTTAPSGASGTVSSNAASPTGSGASTSQPTGGSVPAGSSGAVGSGSMLGGAQIVGLPLADLDQSFLSPFATFAPAFQTSPSAFIAALGPENAVLSSTQRIDPLRVPRPAQHRKTLANFLSSQSEALLADIGVAKQDMNSDGDTDTSSTLRQLTTDALQALGDAAILAPYSIGGIGVEPAEAKFLEGSMLAKYFGLSPNDTSESAISLTARQSDALDGTQSPSSQPAASPGGTQGVRAATSAQASTAMVLGRRAAAYLDVMRPSDVEIVIRWRIPQTNATASLKRYLFKLKWMHIGSYADIMSFTDELRRHPLGHLDLLNQRDRSPELRLALELAAKDILRTKMRKLITSRMTLREKDPVLYAQTAELFSAELRSLTKRIDACFASTLNLPLGSGRTTRLHAFIPELPTTNQELAIELQRPLCMTIHTPVELEQGRPLLHRILAEFDLIFDIQARQMSTAYTGLLGAVAAQDTDRSPSSMAPGTNDPSSATGKDSPYTSAIVSDDEEEEEVSSPSIEGLGKAGKKPSISSLSGGDGRVDESDLLQAETLGYGVTGEAKTTVRKSTWIPFMRFGPLERSPNACLVTERLNRLDHIDAQLLTECTFADAVNKDFVRSRLAALAASYHSHVALHMTTDVTSLSTFDADYDVAMGPVRLLAGRSGDDGHSAQIQRKPGDMVSSVGGGSDTIQVHGDGLIATLTPAGRNSLFALGTPLNLFVQPDQRAAASVEDGSTPSKAQSSVKDFSAAMKAAGVSFGEINPSSLGAIGYLASLAGVERPDSTASDPLAQLHHEALGYPQLVALAPDSAASPLSYTPAMFRPTRVNPGSSNTSDTRGHADVSVAVAVPSPYVAKHFSHIKSRLESLKATLPPPYPVHALYVLRFLRLRSLKLGILSILNFFRSIERKLTLDDYGFAKEDRFQFKSEHVVRSATLGIQSPFQASSEMQNLVSAEQSTGAAYADVDSLSIVASHNNESPSGATSPTGVLSPATKVALSGEAATLNAITHGGLGGLASPTTVQSQFAAITSGDLTAVLPPTEHSVQDSISTLESRRSAAANAASAAMRRGVAESDPTDLERNEEAFMQFPGVEARDDSYGWRRAHRSESIPFPEREIEVYDACGNRIVYDAAIQDLHELETHLLRLGTYYIQWRRRHPYLKTPDMPTLRKRHAAIVARERAEVSEKTRLGYMPQRADPIPTKTTDTGASKATTPSDDAVFEEGEFVDVQLGQSGRLHEMRGIDMIDRWAMLLDLFESEYLFQLAKAKQVHVYFQAYQHCIVPSEQRQLAQRMLEIAARRPTIDLPPDLSFQVDPGSFAATHPTTLPSLGSNIEASLEGASTDEGIAAMTVAGLSSSSHSGTRRASSIRYFTHYYAAEIELMESQTNLLQSVLNNQIVIEREQASAAAKLEEDWRTFLQTVPAPLVSPTLVTPTQALVPKSPPDLRDIVLQATSMADAEKTLSDFVSGSYNNMDDPVAASPRSSAASLGKPAPDAELSPSEARRSMAHNQTSRLARHPAEHSTQGTRFNDGSTPESRLRRIRPRRPDSLQLHTRELTSSVRSPPILEMGSGSAETPISPIPLNPPLPSPNHDSMGGAKNRHRRGISHGELGALEEAPMKVGVRPASPATVHEEDPTVPNLRSPGAPPVGLPVKNLYQKYDTSSISASSTQTGKALASGVPTSANFVKEAPFLVRSCGGNGDVSADDPVVPDPALHALQKISISAATTPFLASSAALGGLLPDHALAGLQSEAVSLVEQSSPPNTLSSQDSKWARENVIEWTNAMNLAAQTNDPYDHTEEPSTPFAQSEGGDVQKDRMVPLSDLVHKRESSQSATNILSSPMVSTPSAMPTSSASSSSSSYGALALLNELPPYLCPPFSPIFPISLDRSHPEDDTLLGITEQNRPKSTGPGSYDAKSSLKSICLDQHDGVGGSGTMWSPATIAAFSALHPSDCPGSAPAPRIGLLDFFPSATAILLVDRVLTACVSHACQQYHSFSSLLGVIEHATQGMAGHDEEHGRGTRSHDRRGSVLSKASLGESATSSRGIHPVARYAESREWDNLCIARSVVRQARVLFEHHIKENWVEKIRALDPLPGISFRGSLGDIVADATSQLMFKQTKSFNSSVSGGAPKDIGAPFVDISKLTSQANAEVRNKVMESMHIRFILAMMTSPTFVQPSAAINAFGPLFLQRRNMLYAHVAAMLLQKPPTPTCLPTPSPWLYPPARYGASHSIWTRYVAQCAAKSLLSKRNVSSRVCSVLGLPDKVDMRLHLATRIFLSLPDETAALISAHLEQATHSPYRHRHAVAALLQSVFPYLSKVARSTPDSARTGTPEHEEVNHATPTAIGGSVASWAVTALSPRSVASTLSQATVTNQPPNMHQSKPNLTATPAVSASLANHSNLRPDSLDLSSRPATLVRSGPAPTFGATSQTATPKGTMPTRVDIAQITSVAQAIRTRTMPSRLAVALGITPGSDAPLTSAGTHGLNSDSYKFKLGAARLRLETASAILDGLNLRDAFIASFTEHLVLEDIYRYQAGLAGLPVNLPTVLPSWMLSDLWKIRAQLSGSLKPNSGASVDSTSNIPQHRASVRSPSPSTDMPVSTASSLSLGQSQTHFMTSAVSQAVLALPMTQRDHEALSLALLLLQTGSHANTLHMSLDPRSCQAPSFDSRVRSRAQHLFARMTLRSRFKSIPVRANLHPTQIAAPQVTPEILSFIVQAITSKQLTPVQLAALSFHPAIVQLALHLANRLNGLSSDSALGPDVITAIEWKIRTLCEQHYSRPLLHPSLAAFADGWNSLFVSSTDGYSAIRTLAPLGSLNPFTLPCPVLHTTRPVQAPDKSSLSPSRQLSPQSMTSSLHARQAPSAKDALARPTSAAGNMAEDPSAASWTEFDPLQYQRSRRRNEVSHQQLSDEIRMLALSDLAPVDREYSLNDTMNLTVRTDTSTAWSPTQVHDIEASRSAITAMEQLGLTRASATAPLLLGVAEIQEYLPLSLVQLSQIDDILRLDASPPQMNASLGGFNSTNLGISAPGEETGAGNDPYHLYLNAVADTNSILFPGSELRTYLSQSTALEKSSSATFEATLEKICRELIFIRRTHDSRVRQMLAAQPEGQLGVEPESASRVRLSTGDTLLASPLSVATTLLPSHQRAPSATLSIGRLSFSNFAKPSTHIRQESGFLNDFPSDLERGLDQQDLLSGGATESPELGSIDESIVVENWETAAKLRQAWALGIRGVIASEIELNLGLATAVSLHHIYQVLADAKARAAEARVLTAEFPAASTALHTDDTSNDWTGYSATQATSPSGASLPADAHDSVHHSVRHETKPDSSLSPSDHTQSAHDTSASTVSHRSRTSTLLLTPAHVKSSGLQVLFAASEPGRNRNAFSPAEFDLATFITRNLGNAKAFTTAYASVGEPRDSPRYDPLHSDTTETEQPSDLGVATMLKRLAVVLPPPKIKLHRQSVVEFDLVHAAAPGIHSLSYRAHSLNSETPGTASNREVTIDGQIGETAGIEPGLAAITPASHLNNDKLAAIPLPSLTNSIGLSPLVIIPSPAWPAVYEGSEPSTGAVSREESNSDDSGIPNKFMDALFRPAPGSAELARIFSTLGLQIDPSSYSIVFGGSEGRRCDLNAGPVADSASPTNSEGSGSSISSRPTSPVSSPKALLGGRQQGVLNLLHTSQRARPESPSSLRRNLHSSVTTYSQATEAAAISVSVNARQSPPVPLDAQLWISDASVSLPWRWNILRISNLDSIAADALQEEFIPDGLNELSLQGSPTSCEESTTEWLHSLHNPTDEPLTVFQDVTDAPVDYSSAFKHASGPSVIYSEKGDVFVAQDNNLASQASAQMQGWRRAAKIRGAIFLRRAQALFNKQLPCPSEHPDPDVPTPFEHPLLSPSDVELLQSYSELLAAPTPGSSLFAEAAFYAAGAHIRHTRRYLPFTSSHPHAHELALSMIRTGSIAATASRLASSEPGSQAGSRVLGSRPTSDSSSSGANLHWRTESTAPEQYEHSASLLSIKPATLHVIDANAVATAAYHANAANGLSRQNFIHVPILRLKQLAATRIALLEDSHDPLGPAGSIAGTAALPRYVRLDSDKGSSVTSLPDAFSLHAPNLALPQGSVSHESDLAVNSSSPDFLQMTPGSPRLVFSNFNPISVVANSKLFKNSPSSANHYYPKRQFKDSGLVNSLPRVHSSSPTSMFSEPSPISIGKSFAFTDMNHDEQAGAESRTRKEVAPIVCPIVSSHLLGYFRSNPLLLTAATKMRMHSTFMTKLLCTVQSMTAYVYVLETYHLVNRLRFLHCHILRESSPFLDQLQSFSDYSSTPQPARHDVPVVSEVTKLIHASNQKVFPAYQRARAFQALYTHINVDSVFSLPQSITHGFHPRADSQSAMPHGASVLPSEHDEQVDTHSSGARPISEDFTDPQYRSRVSVKLEAALSSLISVKPLPWLVRATLVDMGLGYALGVVDDFHEESTPPTQPVDGEMSRVREGTSFSRFNPQQASGASKSSSETSSNGPESASDTFTVPGDDFRDLQFIWNLPTPGQLFQLLEPSRLDKLDRDKLKLDFQARTSLYDTALLLVSLVSILSLDSLSEDQVTVGAAAHAAAFTEYALGTKNNMFATPVPVATNWSHILAVPPPHMLSVVPSFTPTHSKLLASFLIRSLPSPPPMVASLASGGSLSSPITEAEDQIATYLLTANDPALGSKFILQGNVAAESERTGIHQSPRQGKPFSTTGTMTSSNVPISNTIIGPYTVIAVAGELNEHKVDAQAHAALLLQAAKEAHGVTTPVLTSLVALLTTKRQTLLSLLRLFVRLNLEFSMLQVPDPRLQMPSAASTHQDHAPQDIPAETFATFATRDSTRASAHAPQHEAGHVLPMDNWESITETTMPVQLCKDHAAMSMNLASTAPVPSCNVYLIRKGDNANSSLNSPPMLSVKRNNRLMKQQNATSMKSQRKPPVKASDESSRVHPDLNLGSDPRRSYLESNGQAHSRQTAKRATSSASAPNAPTTDGEVVKAPEHALFSTPFVDVLPQDRFSHTLTALRLAQLVARASVIIYPEVELAERVAIHIRDEHRLYSTLADRFSNLSNESHLGYEDPQRDASPNYLMNQTRTTVAGQLGLANSMFGYFPISTADVASLLALINTLDIDTMNDLGDLPATVRLRPWRLMLDPATGIPVAKISQASVYGSYSAARASSASGAGTHFLRFSSLADADVAPHVAQTALRGAHACIAPGRSFEATLQGLYLEVLPSSPMTRRVLREVLVATLAFVDISLSKLVAQSSPSTVMVQSIVSATAAALSPTALRSITEGASNWSQHGAVSSKGTAPERAPHHSRDSKVASQPLHTAVAVLPTSHSPLAPELVAAAMNSPLPAHEMRPTDALGLLPLAALQSARSETTGSLSGIVTSQPSKGAQSRQGYGVFTSPLTGVFGVCLGDISALTLGQTHQSADAVLRGDELAKVQPLHRRGPRTTQPDLTSGEELSEFNTRHVEDAPKLSRGLLSITIDDLQKARRPSAQTLFNLINAASLRSHAVTIDFAPSQRNRRSSGSTHRSATDAHSRAFAHTVSGTLSLPAGPALEMFAIASQCKRSTSSPVVGTPPGFTRERSDITKYLDSRRTLQMRRYRTFATYFARQLAAHTVLQRQLITLRLLDLASPRIPQPDLAPTACILLNSVVWGESLATLPPPNVDSNISRAFAFSLNLSTFDPLASVLLSLPSPSSPFNLRVPSSSRLTSFLLPPATISSSSTVPFDRLTSASETPSFDERLGDTVRIPAAASRKLLEVVPNVIHPNALQHSEGRMPGIQPAWAVGLGSLVSDASTGMLGIESTELSARGPSWLESGSLRLVMRVIDTLGSLFKSSQSHWTGKLANSFVHSLRQSGLPTPAKHRSLLQENAVNEWLAAAFPSNRFGFASLFLGGNGLAMSNSIVARMQSSSTLARIICMDLDATTVAQRILASSVDSNIVRVLSDNFSSVLQAMIQRCRRGHVLPYLGAVLMNNPENMAETGSGLGFSTAPAGGTMLDAGESVLRAFAPAEQLARAFAYRRVTKGLLLASVPIHKPSASPQAGRKEPDISESSADDMGEGSAPTMYTIASREYVLHVPHNGRYLVVDFSEAARALRRIARLVLHTLASRQREDSDSAIHAHTSLLRSWAHVETMYHTLETSIALAARREEQQALIIAHDTGPSLMMIREAILSSLQTSRAIVRSTVKRLLERAREEQLLVTRCLLRAVSLVRQQFGKDLRALQLDKQSRALEMTNQIRDGLRAAAITWDMPIREMEEAVEAVLNETEIRHDLPVAPAGDARLETKLDSRDGASLSRMGSAARTDSNGSDNSATIVKSIPLGPASHDVLVKLLKTREATAVLSRLLAEASGIDVLVYGYSPSQSRSKRGHTEGGSMQRAFVTSKESESSAMFATGLLIRRADSVNLERALQRRDPQPDYLDGSEHTSTEGEPLQSVEDIERAFAARLKFLSQRASLVTEHIRNKDHNVSLRYSRLLSVLVAQRQAEEHALWVAYFGPAASYDATLALIPPLPLVLSVIMDAGVSARSDRRSSVIRLPSIFHHGRVLTNASHCYDQLVRAHLQATHGLSTSPAYAAIAELVYQRRAAGVIAAATSKLWYRAGAGALLRFALASFGRHARMRLPEVMNEMRDAQAIQAAIPNWEKVQAVVALSLAIESGAFVSYFTKFTAGHELEPPGWLRAAQEAGLTREVLAELLRDPKLIAMIPEHTPQLQLRFRDLSPSSTPEKRIVEIESSAVSRHMLRDQRQELGRIRKRTQTAQLAVCASSRLEQTQINVAKDALEREALSHTHSHSAHLRSHVLSKSQPIYATITSKGSMNVQSGNRYQQESIIVERELNRITGEALPRTDMVIDQPVGHMEISSRNSLHRTLVQAAEQASQAARKSQTIEGTGCMDSRVQTAVPTLSLRPTESGEAEWLTPIEETTKRTTMMNPNPHAVTHAVSTDFRPPVIIQSARAIPRVVLAKPRSQPLSARVSEREPPRSGETRAQTYYSTLRVSAQLMIGQSGTTTTVLPSGVKVGSARGERTSDKSRTPRESEEMDTT